MTTIIDVCGSLRRDSFTRMRLRAAAELAPRGMTIEAGLLQPHVWPEGFVDGVVRERAVTTLAAEAGR